MKFVANIPANQQGDERADPGVVELSRDVNEAFVDRARVEPVVKIIVHLVGDLVQVRRDLQWTLVSV